MIEHKPHTVIIGGTKGIGRTIARTLAERGHRVSVLGRSEPFRKIEGVNDWQADLKQPDQYLDIIGRIITQNGPITHLVFSQRYRGEADWDKELAVNLTATRNIIENFKNCLNQTKPQLSPAQQQAPQRSIVIISSIASSYIAEEQNAQYHLAKAALNQLVRYYAAVLGPLGIRVNSISPGTTVKEESREFYVRNPEIGELYKIITPLGRMGTAEDVAKVVAFLCSVDASFVTGQNIMVDGGISLQSHESLARRLTLLKNTLAIPPNTIVTPSNTITPITMTTSTMVALSNQVTGKNKCRLCQSENTSLVMKLAPTPIGDAYLKVKKELACYPLDLYLCSVCGLLQILEVIDSELIYRDYIYHTADSLGLVEHFRNYVESVLKRINPVPNSLVVEIGSNDGSALQCYKNAGMRVLGVDPAREIAEQATQRGTKTLPEFFNTTLAHSIMAEYGKASIVMANNVLANINDLTDIMEGVKVLLAPDGVLIFETGYALDLIQKTIFDNIYHEHLSYFSVKPLQHFFREQGLQLIHVERVPTKGGSIRCTVQLVTGNIVEHPSVAELLALEEVTEIHKVSTLQQFAAEIEKTKVQLTTLLKNLKSPGKKIAGYGAVTGVTTVLYTLGLGQYIDFLVDDNSNRQNRYSPGLQISVKSPEAIYDTDYTVILAWQYVDPIVKRHPRYLQQGGKFINFLPYLTIIGQ